MLHTNLTVFEIAEISADFASTEEAIQVELGFMYITECLEAAGLFLDDTVVVVEDKEDELDNTVIVDEDDTEFEKVEDAIWFAIAEMENEEEEFNAVEEAIWFAIAEMEDGVDIDWDAVQKEVDDMNIEEIEYTPAKAVKPVVNPLYYMEVEDVDIDQLEKDAYDIVFFEKLGALVYGKV